MNKLGERNYLLLSQGAKTTGNYVEAFHYAQESLYVHEAETIYAFCKWCQEDTANRSWGSVNYEMRFKQFLEATLSKNKCMIFEVKRIEQTVETTLIEADSLAEAEAIAEKDHVSFGKNEVVSAEITAEEVNKFPKGRIIYTATGYKDASGKQHVITG